jgi:hypothetical protein
MADKTLTWEKDEGISYECHRLRAGPIRASAVGATPAWEPGWSVEYVGKNSRWFESASLDAAKTAAEQALREMHDALAAHFAPVLRWEDTDDARPDSTASVCGWELHAAHGNWALQHESGATLYSPRPNQSSREANRRAAEDALRSLGVAFRTEGER